MDSLNPISMHTEGVLEGASSSVLSSWGIDVCGANGIFNNVWNFNPAGPHSITVSFSCAKLCYSAVRMLATSRLSYLLHQLSPLAKERPGLCADLV